jgi:predicted RNase H-like HicB family nuclease
MTTTAIAPIAPHGEVLAADAAGDAVSTVATPLRVSTVEYMATVHVPITVEQDEDGVWCAHAWLGSSGGANGNGATPDEAIADLREAVEMVIDEDGVPAQLAQTLDLEVA